MKRIAVCLVFGVALAGGFVGCAEKTKVQETKKVETPTGSTTEKTTTEESKTGDQKANP
jgi:hypothetical protein